MAKNEKNRVGAMLFCVVTIIAFSLILILPQSRELFGALTSRHPFLMSFIKFALLAMSGELIAIRLAQKGWRYPSYGLARAIVWGGLGIAIAVAFKIFGAGVYGMLEAGTLPGGTGGVWTAFMTSFWCNLFFGPFMMGLHKLTDAYLDLKADGGKNITLTQVAGAVKWNTFVTFTLCKTVPLFWVPAHTITFMLPTEYQTIMAAYLSIALGIILNLKKEG